MIEGYLANIWPFISYSWNFLFFLSYSHRTYGSICYRLPTHLLHISCSMEKKQNLTNNRKKKNINGQRKLLIHKTNKVMLWNGLCNFVNRWCMHLFAVRWMESCKLFYNFIIKSKVQSTVRSKNLQFNSQNSLTFTWPINWIVFTSVFLLLNWILSCT